MRIDASARLQALYLQGIAAQWNPTLAVDWTLTVPYGSELAQDVGLHSYLSSSLGHHGRATWNRFRWEFQTWLVSQFLYGEKVALEGAARMVQLLPDPDAKQAAAVQVMDEARHVAVFTRYLTEHAPDGPYAISPAFTEFVQWSLQQKDWDFSLLGIQVLIEGVALAAFRMAQSTLHDPLIRSIVQAVQRDEARHTAFGLINLKPLYATMSAQERRERSDFLLAAVELTLQRFLLAEVWDRVGIERRAGTAFAQHDPIMSAYRRTVLLKVVSIIRGVGLLDATLQRNLAALGIGARDGLPGC